MMSVRAIGRQCRRIGAITLFLASSVTLTTCETPFVSDACGADTSPSNNWSQFRGPGGQGRADVEGVPIRWSESEGVVWKVEVPGEGHSSPVVSGDRIWLTTALDEGKSLRAVCFDLQDGDLLHNVEAFRPTSPVPKDARNSYATPTPVVDSDCVWIHFGTMGTACVAQNTGDVLWRNQEFQIEHETGPAASPILVNDLLVVHFDGMNEQFIVALEKQSGNVVWKTARSQPFREDPVLRRAFSTPLFVNDRSVHQIVSVAADQTHAYDPLTGREIWHVTYQGTSNIPYPLYGHGMIYLITGFRTPELWAVRPDGQGDVTDTHVQWKIKKAVPAVSSPILVDKTIFMVSETGVGSGVDAKTGELVWRSRLTGNFSASPVFAAGHIYFPGEEGTTTVIAVDAAPRIVSSNTISGRIRATPAIVDGAILLRSDRHLYRIGTSD